MNRAKPDIIKTIAQNEKYRFLVKLRTRFALKLSALVLVAYYAFMMIVAFKPSLLRSPINDASVISIGFPIAIFMFVLFWLLTGWYVQRSNTLYDQMSREILDEVLK